MKRTGEFVLGIIGAVGYTFFTFIAIILIWFQNNEELMRDSFQRVVEQNPAQLEVMDIDLFISSIQNVSAVSILLLFAGSLIAGIIAMIALRKNKKPILAGILFIGAAVISTIFSGGVTIFAAIFYLIAGIMSVARKPKVTV
ncbi:hypothetical protein BTS2_2918 [Bacillus sp. TS-2]|nr:hypothetical protein BTS2_2918 [Bacillus sp. TS-2]